MSSGRVFQSLGPAVLFMFSDDENDVNEFGNVLQAVTNPTRNGSSRAIRSRGSIVAVFWQSSGFVPIF